jgi:predicted esterase
MTVDAKEKREALSHSPATSQGTLEAAMIPTFESRKPCCHGNPACHNPRTPKTHQSMRFAHISIILTLATLAASARPWTNTDGKTIEAEYVSSDANSVVLEIAGRNVTYPLDKLSEADREYVTDRVANTPKPRTGAFSAFKIDARLFPEVDDYWQDRDRKSVRQAFESGGYFKDSNKGTYPEWVARDEAKDTCQFYVPAAYDGSEPYGLLLYINSGDSGEIPRHWHAVLDELKLIAVGADNVGNNQPMMRRVQRSIDALATAQKHHRIDPARRIVTGLSGGGHMAMLTGALFPEYFLGAISHAAQSYLPGERSPGHFPGLTTRDLKRGKRADMRWMVVSGDKDYNHSTILETSRHWEKERLTYRFLDVPGMAHTTAGAEPMKEALLWVMER